MPIPPSPPKVIVRNAGSLVGERRALNFLSGFTFTDDPTNNEVEITPTAVAYPAGTGVMVTNAGAESVADDTDETLTFDTETVDTDAFHTGGSPGRLTVPSGKDGTYQAAFALSFAADADGYRQVTLLKNGSPVAGYTHRVAASPTLATALVGAFPPLALVATDYLELRVRHTAGAAINVEAGFGFGMWLVASTASGATAAHDHTATGGDGGKLTNDEHDGYSLYEQIATPATPASGKMAVFAGTDDMLKTVDDGGVVRTLGSMVRLDEILVGSGGAASAVLTVPAGYRHLIVYWAARCDNATVQPLNLRMNADTAANYDAQHLLAANTTPVAVQTIGGTSILVGYAAPTGAPASSFNAGEFKVVNYAATVMHKFITGTFTRVDAHTSGNVFVYTVAGKWRNTAAITSLTLLPATGNFVEHSRFTLYGLA